MAFMELLARLSVVRLRAGEMVLREGEAGDACYLIAAGQGARHQGRRRRWRELGPGSFFGEFAVLSDQRRHASVTAIEPVELLEIRRDLHRRAGGGASGRGAHAAHVLSRAAVADAAGDGAVLRAPERRGARRHRRALPAAALRARRADHRGGRARRRALPHPRRRGRGGAHRQGRRDRQAGHARRRQLLRRDVAARAAASRRRRCRRRA